MFLSTKFSAASGLKLSGSITLATGPLWWDARVTGKFCMPGHFFQSLSPIINRLGDYVHATSLANNCVKTAG
eukprot:3237455-Pyramimonas_sp.AAC.1